MAEEEEKTIPQHLYHYYKVTKYTEAIFTKNQIHFSSPSSFNDPHDTRIHYVLEGSSAELESWAREMQKAYPCIDVKAIVSDYHTRRKLVDYFNKDLDNPNNPDSSRNNFGLFCLSEKRDNILMWAHYSDYHKGFCLKFSTNHDFFDQLLQVIYDNHLPKHNLIDGLIVPKNTLVTKAKDWEYEEEWRLFRTKGPNDYNYTFPAEALTGVIFGCRITPENKEKIINWCRQRNPRPQLYNAVPKATEYGLDIVPFDYPA